MIITYKYPPTNDARNELKDERSISNSINIPNYFPIFAFIFTSFFNYIDRY